MGVVEGHEVCLPDRILPSDIKAMSVSTPMLKELVETALRQADMVYKDIDNIERLKTNNIPLTDFILIKSHIDEDVVKNCGPS